MTSSNTQHKTTVFVQIRHQTKVMWVQRAVALRIKERTLSMNRKIFLLGCRAVRKVTIEQQLKAKRQRAYKEMHQSRKSMPETKSCLSIQLRSSYRKKTPVKTCAKYSRKMIIGGKWSWRAVKKLEAGMRAQSKTIEKKKKRWKTDIGQNLKANQIQ